MKWIGYLLFGAGSTASRKPDTSRGREVPARKAGTSSAGKRRA